MNRLIHEDRGGYRVYQWEGSNVWFAPINLAVEILCQLGGLDEEAHKLREKRLERERL